MNKKFPSIRLKEMKKHLFFFLQTATDCEPHLKIKQLTTSWGIKSHLSFIYLELVGCLVQSVDSVDPKTTKYYNKKK